MGSVLFFGEENRGVLSQVCKKEGSQNTLFYYVPVQEEEKDYLLASLQHELQVERSEWCLYQETMTGEISILIQMHRPLSLTERRKIVSCGLEIVLGGAE